MPWADEPDHPFAGIAKKLERADENIVNLHNEIIRFFNTSKYPIIPDENTEGWQEAIDYHRNLSVPIRFGVLCGEVVHHFRSCLDHIAWHFSSAAYRRESENAIEFPIYSSLPSTKEKMARYERKIEGITNTNVRQLIDKFQPYQRRNDSADHPLGIIHDMDRFDKHRELVIIGSCVNLTLPGATISDILSAIRYSQGETLSPAEIVAAERTLKSHVKATPQIAFSQFGNRKTQPVIPALKQLQVAMDGVVEMFASEV